MASEEYIRDLQIDNLQAIKNDIADIKEVLCFIHDYGQFLRDKPPEVKARYNKLYRKWMKEGDKH